MEKLSPFNTLVGPLYERRDGETVSIGLQLEEKHTNSRGKATAACSPRWPISRSAMPCPRSRAGDWIESRVEIQRVGSRLAFANCYLLANGARIVRASAIFARAGERE